MIDTRAIALGGLTAVLALAGCGSSDSGTATTSTAAATAATAAAATAPATKPAAARKVAIKGFAYTPRTLTVTRGTTVAWTNDDTANHTVTFKKSRKDLGNQPKGSTKHFTFKQAGTYAYYCDFHPYMHGTVVVK